MKKLIIILALLTFFLLPLACHAADVIFVWDCKDCLDLHGYKLYQTKESGVYDANNPVAVINDPNIRTYRVTNLIDGVYYWACTAFENHEATPDLPPIYNESGPSNEVSLDLDTIAPTEPHLDVEAIIKFTVIKP